MVFSVFWILMGWGVAPGAREHDFLNLYTGAALALSGRFADLHDYETQLDFERNLVPSRRVLVPFVRPTFYAALLAPLATLPYGQAFWVWISLHTVGLITAWVWAWRRLRPDALLLGSLYLPTALGIAHGQDCVAMLWVLLGSYILLQKEYLVWAGLVLALGLAKFHLLILFPLVLAVARQWRMLAGFAGGGLLLAVVSLLLSGPQGLARYVDLLRRKDLERLSPSPEQMINVHAIPANLHMDSPAIAVLLLAVVVILTLVPARRGPCWAWFSAAAAGSLLASPHVYGYDASLLLLPLWLAVFRSQFLLTRAAACILIAPLSFFGALLPAPWSVTPSLVLLVFLGAVARESYRSDPALAVQP